MKLLALDPSTKCTGYAVLHGLEPADLHEAGRLTPSLARDALALSAWKHRYLLGLPELTHVRKIRSICQDIAAVIEEHQPTRIIVEIASGKFGSGAKQGSKGALTTYGMMAWAALAEAERWLPDGTAEVTERQWTRGTGGKDNRQAMVYALYGGDRYEPSADPGQDVSDAIALGRWWLTYHEPMLRGSKELSA